MINFHRATLGDKARYDEYLNQEAERGCEYSFANLYLWGRQEIAFIHNCVAFFSHFYGRTLYPYPIGSGDKKAVIEAILQDAKDRGIPCRITGMTHRDKEDLERWFPEKFQFIVMRDSFDYVYTVDALADLRGRKLQKKRNHFNRFQADHPNYQILPLDETNMTMAHVMVVGWYAHRRLSDPDGDYLLENRAITKVFEHYDPLKMEGCILMDGSEVLAVTMGSRLSEDTFDIHFEKAWDDVDGAYSAINCEFARYLRLKYPELKYLNREDDMGLEGLRKAKLSYHPDHMVEKYWACLAEDMMYED